MLGAPGAVVLVHLVVHDAGRVPEAVAEGLPFVLGYGAYLVPFLLVLPHAAFELLDVVLLCQGLHVAGQGLLQGGVLPQVVLAQFLVDADVVEEVVQQVGVVALQVAIVPSRHVADGLPLLLQLLEALEGGTDVLLLGDQPLHLVHHGALGGQVVGLLLGALAAHVVHALVEGVQQQLEALVILVLGNGVLDGDCRCLGGSLCSRIGCISFRFLLALLVLSRFLGGVQDRLISVLHGVHGLRGGLGIVALEQFLQPGDQLGLRCHRMLPAHFGLGPFKDRRVLANEASGMINAKG